MEFIDVKAQYEALKNGIDERIRRVLSHGRFIMGPEVPELENRLAAYAGAGCAVSCSSGTDALLMPLMAWGAGEGDAVFVPAFTFFATAEVPALAGATPVFVDIEPDAYCIDAEALEDAVRRVLREGRLRPKAVIPVDLFGQPADYGAVGKVAGQYGLKVLEDAAQAFGATDRGRRAGTFGDAAATSFFPAKPLGCFGDGGAMFTGDDALAEALRSIRAHGQGGDRYENVRLGLNGRLDTLQAAVLLAKLDAFDIEIVRRNEIAALYTEALGGSVKTPAVRGGCTSTWAEYSVLADNGEHRRRILARLAEQGIPSAIYYPIPLHLQKAFAHLGYRRGDMPVAEDCSQRILSLPMHAYLKDGEAEAVAAAVTAA